MKNKLTKLIKQNDVNKFVLNDYYFIINKLESIYECNVYKYQFHLPFCFGIYSNSKTNLIDLIIQQIDLYEKAETLLKGQ